MARRGRICPLSDQFLAGLSAWINSWGAGTRMETRARIWWGRAMRHLPSGDGNHQVGPVVQGTGLFPSYQCHWLCGSTNKEIKEKKPPLKQRYKYSLKLLVLTEISNFHVEYCELDFQGFLFPKSCTYLFEDKSINPFPFSSQPSEGSGISLSSCAPVGSWSIHPKIPFASQKPRRCILFINTEIINIERTNC